MDYEDKEVERLILDELRSNTGLRSPKELIEQVSEKFGYPPIKVYMAFNRLKNEGLIEIETMYIVKAVE